MKSETAKSLLQSPKEKELLEEKQRETITKSNYLVEKTRRGQTCQFTNTHQAAEQEMS